MPVLKRVQKNICRTKNHVHGPLTAPRNQSTARIKVIVISQEVLGDYYMGQAEAAMAIYTDSMAHSRGDALLGGEQI